MMSDRIDRFPADIIEKLADEWGTKSGSPYRLLWQDIRCLADHYWQLEARPDSAEKRVTWHHLLLAVGNFKRQRGTVIRPLRDSLALSMGSEKSSFRIPEGAEITRDDEESWKELERAVPGLGIPTTTVLLAALWPENHAIVDRRTAQASLAVAHDREWFGIIDDPTSSSPFKKLDWRFYAKYYLRWLSEWAQQLDPGPDPPLLRVERALFRLDELLGTKGGRSWDAYRNRVEEKVRSLRN
jgi:hypothetical protein